MDRIWAFLNLLLGSISHLTAKVPGLEPHHSAVQYTFLTELPLFLEDRLGLESDDLATRLAVMLPYAANAVVMASAAWLIDHLIGIGWNRTRCALERALDAPPCPECRSTNPEPHTCVG